MQLKSVKIYSKTLLAAFLLTSAAHAFAGTYYVDYQTGKDSNPGSKALPWKHCPTMEPFSGAYTHAAGDRFIFKGGVTWPNAALPMKIAIGGTELNPDYYGVDVSWFNGVAWSRPIFDGESIFFTNWGGNRDDMFYVYKANHVVIDGFEVKNWIHRDLLSTSISDGLAVFVQVSDNVTVTNLYAHDWIVQTLTDGKFGGIAQSESSRISALKCRIVAPPSVAAAFTTATGGTSSGAGLYNIHTVDGCEIVGTTQGIFGGVLVRNNIVRDGGNSFDAGSHENGIWMQNGVDFYNNKVFNLKQGVGAYFLPGWGARSGRSMKIYNNIFFNVPQINLTPDQSPDVTNELLFFNNVVQRGSYCINLGSTKAGAAFKRLAVQNNVFISDWKYTLNANNIVTILNPDQLGPDYANDHNVIYSKAEATTAGLLESTFFRPVVPPSILSKSGTGIFYTISQFDHYGYPRPDNAGWDIGPYSFGILPKPPADLQIQ